MKLNINKACDLSSISVLPPHSRGANTMPSGTDSSVYGRSQGYQLRSQSQQSFSQGTSLSQLSQNSFDENLTNEQKFGSLERDNSVKRISCLAPITFTRGESQMPMSRSSNNNVTRRWSSAPIPDYRCKCQVSEELVNRIGLMETSLSRFGMILDSVQSDVMQVNKSVKEVLLGMEGFREKLVLLENSLQIAIKGEEEIKTSIEKSLQSVLDQFRKESYRNKFEEIRSALAVVPLQIQAHLLKLQNELCWTIPKEVAKLSSLNPLIVKNQLPVIQPSMRTSGSAIQSSKKQESSMQMAIVPTKPYTSVRKTTISNLKPLEPTRAIFANKKQKLKPKKEEILVTDQEQDWRIIVESDEEINGGFSCLYQEKEIGTGSHLIQEVKVETERILRKARRRKRKACNTVIYV